MKTLFFPVIAIVVTLASFTSADDTNFNIGDKAPMLDYQMKDITDNATSIAKEKMEKGVIVVFSCNTCPFVVGSKGFEGWEKQYNDLHKIAKKSGLGFVLINSNEAKRAGDDSMEEMKIHAQAQKYTMNYAIDQNSELANAYGAKTTPHVFVLNEKNVLIYRGSIDNSWDTKRDSDLSFLKNAINEIAKGKTISTTDTTPKGCSIKRV